LVAYRARLHDLLARVVAAQVATAANAVAAYRALEDRLARFAGDDASAVAQRLTAGAVHADGQRALDVTAVIEHLGADALDHVLAGADDLEGFQRRLESEGSEAARGSLAGARRRAGSTAIPGGPTWAEQDDLTLDALRAGRSGDVDTPDPAEALAEFERELCSTWQWRFQRLLTGQVVDVRRRFLRRLVDDATRLLAHRDELKLIALRLGGESRRTAQRAAELLHGSGRLPEPGDVELLTDLELRGVLTGGPVPADLAARRRAHEQDLDAERLPIAFIGDPSRPAPITQTAADGDASGDGDVLSGWAASAGRHRGAAVVVEEAASSSLQEGDVLVAHATDPSWTPLFVRAGAIVVEEGGPLSHAAIVARELGKPAVLNVPGVVDRLREGGEVTVDGSAGTVLVHEVAP
jgi:phosphohistidine swiveling domain-containing protein